MSSAPKRTFHHVGLTTLERQPKEDYVAPSKCWVTDPRNHFMTIEFLRYEDDSPVSQEFQASPHIAYAVDELEPHLEGKEVILSPFEVGEPAFATVAFTKEDGIFVEYMKFKPGRHWFND
jgi:hypothetical protein